MQKWELLSYTFILVYFLFLSAKLGFLKVQLSRYLFIFFELYILLIGLYYIQSGSIAAILIFSPFGIIYLPIMFLFTSPSLKYFLRFSYNLLSWIRSVILHPKLYVYILLNTLKEELIWRSAFVNILRSIYTNDLAILLSGSILFYLLHWPKKSKFTFMTEIELYIFSLLLYFLYLRTDSLIVVWIIHFIRNSYLKFFRLRLKNAY
jgi:membrane protease YdiL (CAAX protease family)